MANPVISVEARLIDHLTKDLEKVGAAFQRTMAATATSTKAAETATKSLSTSQASLAPLIAQSEKQSALLIHQLQKMSADGRRTQEALAGIRGSLDSMATGMAQAGSAAEGAETKKRSLLGTLNSLRGAYFTVAGVVGGVLVQGLVKAGLEADRLDRTMRFAMGGAIAGGEAFAFVSEEADRLGIHLQRSALSYARLAAAARGTTLEGEKSRDLFKGIAQAATTLGLSSDQTEGAINALQQMISKGTVQAEELRGQLGERLPGAFQLAARSMGVSTAELGKMMEQGELFADEFLPRFAKAMQDEYGKPAEEASKSAAAAMTRFGNDTRTAAAIVGGVMVDALGGMAKGYILAKEAILGAAEAQSTYLQGFGGTASTAMDAAAAREAGLNAAKAEGLRLAKEAKGLEDQKVKGPSNRQQEEIKRLLKEEAKEKKKALEDAERQAKETADKVQRQQEEAARMLGDAQVAAIQDANLREIATIELKYTRLLTAAEGNARATKDLNLAANIEIEAQAQRHAVALSKARLNQTKEQHKMEQDAIEKTILMQKQASDRKKRILEAEIQAYSAFYNGFAGLLQAAGQHSRTAARVGQGVSSVAATIDTYAAANKALASAPPPANFIAMAGVIAAGLGNVIKINSQKFEQGGPVYGNSHRQGGVPAELEGGEYVLSRATVARMGGQRGVEAAIGGTVSNSFTVNYTPTINAAGMTAPALRQLLAEDKDALVDALRDLKRKGYEA